MSIFSPDQDIVDTRRGNKYYDIALELKRRMDGGEIRTRLPSLPQICREFKTTPVTAHKAVGLLKREGLVKSIKGKGTFVSRLKRVRAGVIEGILVGVPYEGTLHAALVRGFQDACDQADLRLIVSHHDNDAARALKLVREMWESERVDGFVIWPVMSARPEKTPDIRYLQKHKVPFVLVPDVDPEVYGDCHRVNNDELAVAERLVAHLISRGHKRIAYVATRGFESTNHGRLRYRAYRHVMQQQGLNPSPPIIVDNAEDWENERGGPSLGIQALRGATAAFCFTDDVAMAVIRICLREGIRVPGDLEVAGFANTHPSRMLGFSSADQHFDAIGRSAVRLLVREIEGELKGPVCETVPAQAVFR